MATITKRGNSYRATVSLYKKGEYKRETKTFSNRKDAELWTLEMELEKVVARTLPNDLPYFLIFIEIGSIRSRKMTFAKPPL